MKKNLIVIAYILLTIYVLGFETGIYHLLAFAGGCVIGLAFTKIIKIKEKK